MSNVFFVLLRVSKDKIELRGFQCAEILKCIEVVKMFSHCGALDIVEIAHGLYCHEVIAHQNI